MSFLNEIPRNHRNVNEIVNPTLLSVDHYVSSTEGAFRRPMTIRLVFKKIYIFINEYSGFF